MIESNFEYTEKLINKINTASVKKYNIIIEITMFMILLGAVVLFITGNTVLGVAGCIIFVLMAISLFLNNKEINRSNRILIGQKVNIVFKSSDMLMTTKLGNKVLYKSNFEYGSIKKIVENEDLVFIYFDKVSVVIFPKSSFKSIDDYKKAMQFVGNNYIV